MGNNHSCLVVGIGSITVKLNNGLSHVLANVRHIPDLRRNLISLGTLDDAGYVCKTEGGVLKVSRGSLVILKGSKNQGLYVL